MIHIHRTRRKRLDEPAVSGYTLPFKRAQEEPVTIVQGYNGLHGHQVYQRVVHVDLFEMCVILDDTYSLDFQLPVGTPVLAAKPGRYIVGFDQSSDYYDGTSYTYGKTVFPNMVVLGHSDGTRTLYAHLEEGSIPDDFKYHGKRNVAQGEVIGATGLSGWVGTIPNLHFAAFENQGPHRITFPTRFRNFENPFLS